MIPEERDRSIAESLKTLAHDNGAMGASLTYRTSSTSWRTITVSEAWILGDSQDGWDVETKDTDL